MDSASYWIVYFLEAVKDTDDITADNVALNDKDTLEAVSYTHLDVYKRQVLLLILDVPY